MPTTAAAAATTANAEARRTPIKNEGTEEVEEEGVVGGAAN